MLLIGESGVGKTSLLVRFNDGVYTSPRRSTIGVDYKAKDVNIDGQAMKLQIVCYEERLQHIYI